MRHCFCQQRQPWVAKLFPVHCAVCVADFLYNCFRLVDVFVQKQIHNLSGFITIFISLLPICALVTWVKSITFESNQSDSTEIITTTIDISRYWQKSLIDPSTNLHRFESRAAGADQVWTQGQIKFSLGTLQVEAKGRTAYSWRERRKHWQSRISIAIVCFTRNSTVEFECLLPVCTAHLCVQRDYGSFMREAFAMILQFSLELDVE